MRKSFNGLHAMAVDHLRLTPGPNTLFAFTNKRRNRIKLLYFDGNLELDTKLFENRIRPAKVGMKNYLFFGCLEAGMNHALAYTL